MTQPTPDLEARLHALAERAAWPVTPDVVGTAVGRIRAGASMTGAPGTARQPLRGRSGLVLALVLLALLIAAAVAGAALFGLPDLRFGTTDVLPSAAVRSDPLAIRQWLGRPGDLTAARAALGEDLLVPELLGEPDEVYLGDGRMGRVALVYHPGPDAPAVADGLGVIVTEWRGGFDDRFARKWLQDDKGHAEVVDIGGTRGYWVSGIPHVLEFLDDESGIRRTISRIVGDVLVWQDGSMVYRIESPLGRDTTLDIAASMR